MKDSNDSVARQPNLSTLIVAAVVVAVTVISLQATGFWRKSQRLVPAIQRRRLVAVAVVEAIILGAFHLAKPARGFLVGHVALRDPRAPLVPGVAVIAKQTWAI